MMLESMRPPPLWNPEEDTPQMKSCGNVAAADFESACGARSIQAHSPIASTSGQMVITSHFRTLTRTFIAVLLVLFLLSPTAGLQAAHCSGARFLRRCASGSTASREL